MKTILTSYVVAVVIFLSLDALWLKVMGPTFYARELGSLLRGDPNLYVALGFYLLYVVGLCYFAIHPGLTTGSVLEAVLRGALFGLIAYATYDLTNLSTMNGFSTRVAFVDMAWGTTVSALVSGLTVAIMRRFGLA
jgi:uncharacterized membrane protein